MTVALMIFALNEVEGMKVVLPRIKKEWFHEILVVDGGSTDGSVEYCRSLGLNVLVQKQKGAINGLREGFEALQSEYVITYSPDNNMIPETLPQLVAKLNEGYDMVIASRYLNGAKSQDDSPVSGFGNWLFTTMVNVLFGAKYTDVLGFYRGYRIALLNELNIDLTTAIDTVLCIRCTQNKLKVCEIAADEPKRIGGTTKRSIVYHGWVELTTILSEFFRPKTAAGFKKVPGGVYVKNG